MSDFVADALAEIPGWESASYSEITGSLTNRCWLLEVDDRKAVLKLDESPRTEPFNSRPAEALVQNRALDLGIANAVLFVNETALLTEYVEGTVWSEGCLLVDENLDKLAAAMRILHSMPLTGRTFDAVDNFLDLNRNVTISVG